MFVSDVRRIILLTVAYLTTGYVTAWVPDWLSGSVRPQYRRSVWTDTREHGRVVLGATAVSVLAVGDLRYVPVAYRTASAVVRITWHVVTSWL